MQAPCVQPPWEVVAALAATTKKLEKEEIVRQAYLEGCYEFFEGAKLAYDKMITFNVAKVPETPGDGQAVAPVCYESFVNSIALPLARRELTGHAARDMLENESYSCSPEQWNGWYRRILLKDLSCGITEGTINRTLDKLAKENPHALTLKVPVFAIQRAHDGGAKNNGKRIKGKRYLDWKFDGARLATAIDRNAAGVVQYTRSGKINTNFPHITQALAKIRDHLDADIVLDGEIMSDNFNNLMTMLNRKNTPVDTSGAILCVFDLVGLEEFRAGYDPTPQSERHARLLALQDLFDAHCDGRVIIVHKDLVDLDTPEGQARMAEMKITAAEVVDAEFGRTRFEGIMVKDPDGPYEGKKGYHWLKVKPWLEIDLPVIALAEGEPDGKRAGMIGRVLCQGLDEDSGKEITVTVGSGFKDEQWQEFTDHPEKIIGQIITIRCDAITDNEDGTHSLRFPRFVKFRSMDETPGEKD